MNYYLDVMRDNYANFNGRASRQTFWMFFLIYIVLIVFSVVLDNIFETVIYIDTGFGEVSMGYGWIYIIFSLIHLIPYLAVCVRRLHDVGKSGWFILINFIPLIGAILFIIALAKTGDPNENQYGEII